MEKNALRGISVLRFIKGCHEHSDWRLILHQTPATQLVYFTPRSIYLDDNRTLIFLNASQIADSTYSTHKIIKGVNSHNAAYRNIICKAIVWFISDDMPK